MSPLEVVFIAPALGEASARLRIGAALPLLGEEGIRGVVAEIPRKSRERWAFFRGLAAADVVVLHRKLLNFLELAFLRRNVRRLVFDFDDAVMVRDSFRKEQVSSRRRRRFGNVVAKADAMVAGNHYLRERALEAGAMCEVRVIPTGVDVSKYSVRRAPERDGLVLGWIGQAATLPYLVDILPALERLGESMPGLVLRVIADAFPDSVKIPIERKPWSEAEEAELLSGINVGLMPLRDDPWSRGKCGYKILQYFAARRPVVASPVGVNSELVRPGKNGFLAASPEQWIGNISVLAGDGAVRAAFGEEGFASLEGGGYTLGAYSTHLGSFLRSLG